MRMEMTPEEMIRETSKKMGDVILDLSVKYGNDNLGSMMISYADRLESISLLNKKIADQSPEGSDEQQDAFNDTVQEIMSATREYYAYLGKLPEDVRGFFLKMADISDPGVDVMGELSKIMDIPLQEMGTSLLTMQAIRPRNYIMQIDTITNQLASLGEHTQFRVGKKAGQPVLTTVTLDMPDHMRIEGGHALSTYDKSIINGVTTLMENGNTVFSIPMLYHAMTGKQNPTVDQDLFEELAGKLEKMRRMMLSIDLSEERNAQFISDENGDQTGVTDLTLEGYLLPLNKISGVVNGKKAEMYQIIQYPPLYTYSKMRRQMASVRLSLLAAPINNNATTIPLKTYLLQRIEMMKNQRNNIVQENILYDSIYKELGAQDAGKTKKMRIRNYSSTILDYFVEQGYISGYAEYKSGRNVAGIRIAV